MPKVSVCIPTYNQTVYLKKSIDSVLMQSFKDIEIIISDDSTTSEVKNYIESLNTSIPIFYYHHSPSLGSPANWNFSVKKANGEYIKILHHDDYFTNKDSLEEFVYLLDNNPSADMAFSATSILSHKSQTTKKHICSNKNLKALIKNPGILFFENLIGAPSAIIYRNIPNIKFDDRLKWLVDIDFYITLLNSNSNIAYSNNTLITTLNGGEGQITQSVINDKYIQIKEHILLFDRLFENKTLHVGFKNYFTEAFLNFKISSVSELKEIASLSIQLEEYFNVFFKTLKTNYILKKIKFRLYNSYINQRYFHLKKI